MPKFIINVSKYFSGAGKIKVVVSPGKNGKSGYYLHFKNRPVLVQFAKLLIDSLGGVK